MEIGWHQFTINQEDNQNSSENSDESPPSLKAASTSSPKRSRRGAQKRVVHVPIKEVESSRQLKGETNAPPLDSWAWRKYGQKPIKGSPYPRGYYRCSSSKGCPARKQVERSRTDPTMVMVTYSCDHNHPWPASRNNISHHHLNPPPSPPTVNNDDQLDELEPELEPEPEPEPEPELETEPEPKSEQKFTSLELGSCGQFVSTSDQYGWFSDFDTTSSTMLESPLMTRDIVEDSDMTKIFSIREDEESFFADLGELPECATVFRRREIERAEEHRRNLASWCGTTG